MKTILFGLLVASASFAQGVDRGNGGRFTAQDIYLTIGEIGQELKDFKEYKAELDFGISGTDVLNELRAKSFFIVVTDKDVIDRNGQVQDAINFAPDEILDLECIRYGIDCSTKRAKRIMVVKRSSWDRKLELGKSIKSLTTHELWGMMGVKDEGYAYTTDYLLLLSSITGNPTAVVCEAYCEKVSGVGESYTIKIFGYGATMKEAFNDLRSQCENGRFGGRYSSITNAKNVCRYNF